MFFHRAFGKKKGKKGKKITDDEDDDEEDDDMGDLSDEEMDFEGDDDFAAEFQDFDDEISAGFDEENVEYSDDGRSDRFDECHAVALNTKVMYTHQNDYQNSCH